MTETSASTPVEHHSPLEWPDLIRIALVAVGAVWSWFRVWEPVAGIDLVALLAVLIGGYPIFHEAVADLVVQIAGEPVAFVVVHGAP